VARQYQGGGDRFGPTRIRAYSDSRDPLRDPHRSAAGRLSAINDDALDVRGQFFRVFEAQFEQLCYSATDN
jgi:hypothetical protein